MITMWSGGLFAKPSAYNWHVPWPERKAQWPHGARAGCLRSRRAKGRRSVADMAGTQQICRFPASLRARPARLTLPAPTMPAGWVRTSLPCRPLPSRPLPRQTHAGLLWSRVAEGGPFSPSLPLKEHSGYSWYCRKLALFPCGLL